MGTRKKSHTPVKCGPCLRQRHSRGQPSPSTESPCQARSAPTSTLEEPSCWDLVRSVQCVQRVHLGGQHVGQGWLRGEQVSSQTLKCWGIVVTRAQSRSSLRMWPWDPFLGVSLGWF